jgi:hypothetical protein
MEGADDEVRDAEDNSVDVECVRRRQRYDEHPAHHRS